MHEPATHSPVLREMSPTVPTRQPPATAGDLAPLELVAANTASSKGEGAPSSAQRSNTIVKLMF